MTSMRVSCSGRLEGRERSPREALSVRGKDFDGVFAGLEPVIRPGAPAASLADRHHLAQHLDAVTLPEVLQETVAKAGDLRVRVDGLTGEEWIACLRAPYDGVVDDPAAN